mmetsp:Transcript_11233/g.17196  ORF Transcript_11233/g.17196 Transcript_11233/m.17196 type:complete len:169 (+) Transcript_11233:543-1049(+)
MFVYIRMGPYVCAEYNYGGIPEWVPLMKKEGMAMRRHDDAWMQAMQEWITKLTQYLSEHELWAHQGGPIILAQIENELGEDNDTQSTKSNGTIQDYANWCGNLAETLEPTATWTMCNGLTAPNVINTCNGIGEECSKGWLEYKGQNGRVQVDQPAIWTKKRWISTVGR